MNSNPFDKNRSLKKKLGMIPDNGTSDENSSNFITLHGEKSNKNSEGYGLEPNTMHNE
jgi:hypothetical protein